MKKFRWIFTFVLWHSGHLWERLCPLGYQVWPQLSQIFSGRFAILYAYSRATCIYSAHFEKSSSRAKATVAELKQSIISRQYRRLHYYSDTPIAAVPKAIFMLIKPSIAFCSLKSFTTILAFDHEGQTGRLVLPRFLCRC